MGASTRFKEGAGWKARRSGRAGDGCRSMSIPFAACFESIWVGLHASIRHGS